MAPYIARLMQTLIVVIGDTSLHLNLKPNLAIAIGRLSMTNTAQVSAVSEEFFEAFCRLVLS
jgi:hypothetical protein